MSIRHATRLAMNRIVASAAPSCPLHRIYKVTIGLEDKKYIGQTVKMPEERLKEHKRDSSKCTLLKNELRSGKLYDVDVIAVTGSHDVDTLERVAIALENSVAPNGLNMTIGGPGVKFPDEKYERFVADIRKVAERIRREGFASYDILFMKNDIHITEDEFRAVKKLVKK